MEKRRITSCVITGATGMIGATLARLFLSKGMEVTAIVRPGSKKIGNLPVGDEKLNILECELSDYPKLSLKGRKADAFFHFAWDSPFGEGRNNQKLQDQNLCYTKEAVRMAKECGAVVFIGAGSQAQYGNVKEKLREDMAMHPVTAYGKAKLKAEEESRKWCREAGIAHVWTRILSVYGPYDNDYSLVMAALYGVYRHENPAFTKGEQVWDYLFSEDAAEALYRLSESGRDREAYVLGSGETRLLKEYILAIRDAVDSSESVRLGERPYNENQVMYLAADVSKLLQDTGYRPQTPFEEGIKKTLAYVKEREAGDKS